MAWLLVGAAYAFALLGALTIGIVVLPVAVIATVLLVRVPAARIGSTALVSGAGIPILFVAYLNRDGPGNVCTRSATMISCTEEWSPWPWLVVGLALVIAGVVLFLRARRVTSESGHTGASVS